MGAFFMYMKQILHLFQISTVPLSLAQNQGIYNLLDFSGRDFAHFEI
jgi:hypothetical protein